MVLDDYERLAYIEIMKNNEIARLRADKKALIERNDKLKNRINNMIQTHQEPQQTLGQWFDNGFGGLMHSQREVAKS